MAAGVAGSAAGSRERVAGGQNRQQAVSDGREADPDPLQAVPNARYELADGSQEGADPRQQVPDARFDVADARHQPAIRCRRFRTHGW
jgi:hypothetical protein